MDGLPMLLEQPSKSQLKKIPKFNVKETFKHP
jgi:hypothetical protein